MSSFNFFYISGLLLDAAGILGLGLICLAAIRLTVKNHSRGGVTMAIGAVALLLARLCLVTSPHWMNDEALYRIGPIGISLVIGMPPLLLTIGLASIVWGLWGHERWLHDGHH